MKPHERQPQIEAIIRREGEVSVDMLAARFDVSSETIRRDLGTLAERGRVQKVHGGARRPFLIAEPSHGERQSTAAEAKAMIGRRLGDAVAAGETIFIDTGSTTLAAADTLEQANGPQPPLRIAGDLMGKKQRACMLLRNTAIQLAVVVVFFLMGTAG